MLSYIILFQHSFNCVEFYFQNILVYLFCDLESIFDMLLPTLRFAGYVVHLLLYLGLLCFVYVFISLFLVFVVN